MAEHISANHCTNCVNKASAGCCLHSMAAQEDCTCPDFEDKKGVCDFCGKPFGQQGVGQDNGDASVSPDNDVLPYWARLTCPACGRIV